ncbi:RNA editing complex protein MP90, putative,nuclease [Trypanosoma cruzi]|nr:RNA editing complex protein MP90, putative,nuclease [Trypanosoma cruzi]
MDFWVDNTSLQGAANKGSSKTHAMIWKLRRIYVFLALAEYRHPLPTFGLRKTAQTAYDAVVFFCTSAIGEGERRRLVVGGPQSLPLFLFCYTSRPLFVNSPRAVCGNVAGFSVLNRTVVREGVSSDSRALSCRERGHPHSVCGRASRGPSGLSGFLGLR